MDKEKRTKQQNKAIHLFFRQMSDELNEAGLDQRKVLKPGVDIPWTEQAIKEQIWRPVQKAMIGRESTTELSTKDIDKVFDTITRHIGEKFGLFIDFPSIETQMRNEDENNR